MHSAAGRGDYDALRRKAARAASRGLFCLAVIVMFFLSAAVLLSGCTSGADSTPSEDSSDGSVAEQATTLKTRRISACRTIPLKYGVWALRLLTAR